MIKKLFAIIIFSILIQTQVYSQEDDQQEVCTRVYTNLLAHFAKIRIECADAYPIQENARYLPYYLDCRKQLDQSLKDYILRIKYVPEFCPQIELDNINLMYLGIYPAIKELREKND